MRKLLQLVLSPICFLSLLCVGGEFGVRVRVRVVMVGK